MSKRTYTLYVNQFSQREKVDVGFEVEIDYLGDVCTFAYDKALTTGQNVTVAKFEVVGWRIPFFSEYRNIVKADLK